MGFLGIELIFITLGLGSILWVPSFRVGRCRPWYTESNERFAASPFIWQVRLAINEQANSFGQESMHDYTFYF